MDQPLSFPDLLCGLAVALLIFYASFALLQRFSERGIILAALGAKFLASLAYNVYFVFVFRGGDSLYYHSAGIEYAKLLRYDLAHATHRYLDKTPFFDVGYGLPVSSTDRVISFSGLVHFLVFDSFMASTIVFAFIGFIGQLLTYKALRRLYPDSQLAIWWRAGILFFPTLIFWSAGILKDSLGMFGLGCMVWAACALARKFSIANVILLALGAYILFLFRVQVLPVLLLALVPWFLQVAAARSLFEQAPKPGAGGKIMLAAALIVFSLVGLQLVLTAESSFSLEELPQSITTESSAYQQPGLGGSTTVSIVQDRSWAGLITAWPEAVVLTLFRPFLWDATSPLLLFAALENTVIILLVLRAVVFTLGDLTILGRSLRAPLFLTCIIFVLVFALGVGASTPNLGTLSRYRIPLIPFLTATLAILEYNFMQARAMRRRELGIEQGAVEGAGAK